MAIISQSVSAICSTVIPYVKESKAFECMMSQTNSVFVGNVAGKITAVNVFPRITSMKHYEIYLVGSALCSFKYHSLTKNIIGFQNCSTENNLWRRAE